MRQYVNGLRTVTTTVTAAASWTICRWDWLFSGPQGLGEAYVPFFGAVGAAWGDDMVTRRSVNPLEMLWWVMDAAFMSVGRGSLGAPDDARG